SNDESRGSASTSSLNLVVVTWFFILLPHCKVIDVTRMSGLSTASSSDIKLGSENLVSFPSSNVISNDGRGYDNRDNVDSIGLGRDSRNRERYGAIDVSNNLNSNEAPPASRNIEVGCTSLADDQQPFPPCSKTSSTDNSALEKLTLCQSQASDFQLQAVDTNNGRQLYLVLPSSASNVTYDPDVKRVQSTSYCSSSMNKTQSNVYVPNTPSNVSQGPPNKKVKTTFGHLILNDNRKIGLIAHDSGNGANVVTGVRANLSDLRVSRQIDLNEEETSIQPREIKRRIIEKKRRDNINMLISRLARLLPLSSEESSKNLASKGFILSKTVEYIYELQEVNTHLLKTAAANAQAPNRAQDQMREDEISRLRDIVEQLTKENKLLRQKIAENNNLKSGNGSSTTYPKIIVRTEPSQDEKTFVQDPAIILKDSDAQSSHSLNKGPQLENFCDSHSSLDT
uniref:BHLH domain-containing protein n=1 Tax=Romanomermis culicivorax TaxID=13658 RepID=A0A915IYL9_ROMCU